MVEASIVGRILATRHISRARGHQRPRSREGILASRISAVWNVETPMESAGSWSSSRPTAREAERSSGNRMVQEAKASSRKTTGIHNRLDREVRSSDGTT
jgi:hypothetical protein